MLEFLSKGGVLVGPILICSVVALAIFLERWILLARAGFRSRGLAETVASLIREGEVERAEQEARGSRSPVGWVLASMLEVRGSDDKTVEAVVGHAAEEQVQDLSRHLPALAVIAGITPMLGLLGTVMGMIKSFMVIQQMGGKVNAAVLAGGIWEAMLTTALGLAVALPALVAHGYLDSRVDRFESRIRAAVVALTRAMGADASGRTA